MATEKGMAIVIKGFIPIDPRNLKAHGEVIAAIIKAQEDKDFSTLTAIGFRIEDFKADAVTRKPRLTPAPPANDPPGGDGKDPNEPGPGVKQGVDPNTTAAEGQPAGSGGEAAGNAGDPPNPAGDGSGGDDNAAGGEGAATAAPAGRRGKSAK